MADTIPGWIIETERFDCGTKWGVSISNGKEGAERIRHAVEKANLSHPATPQGVVTISVGVAAMVPRAGFSAELLIAAADAALYRAKAGGKNRVEAAGSDHY